MEILNYYDLPKVIQERFKKEYNEKMKLKHKEMGINPSQATLNSSWEWELRKTFFFKEAGNVYFSFKPIKI